MNGFVPERRAPLLLLVVLTALLAMLAYQVRTERGDTVLHQGMRTLVSPLTAGTSWLTRTISGAWDRYLGLRGAHEDAQRARRERDEARARALLAEEALRENRRLRVLLDLRDRMPAPADTTVARVVGGAGDLLSDGLLIDRGRSAGVVPGSPVVAAGGPGGGLVGRVVFASPWQARVQLFTDRSASVAVNEQDTRVGGVVRGAGDGASRLQWIDRPEDARPGGVLVTSGLDDLYPPGIPVGLLLEPGGPVGYGQGIRVRAVVDLEAVEEVLVLPPVKREGPTPEAYERSAGAEGEASR